MEPLLEPLVVGIISGVLYLLFFTGCFLLNRYKRTKHVHPQAMGPLIVGIFAGLLYFCLFLFLRYQRRRRTLYQAQQEQNVYNISGRVPSSNPAEYPDPYLSIEHISITNELNKPPKYDDAPPSYEEALKLAIAQSNSLQTLQAEQPQIHQSASSGPSSTPVMIPAVPNRTTE